MKKHLLALSLLAMSGSQIWAMAAAVEMPQKVEKGAIAVNVALRRLKGYSNDANMPEEKKALASKLWTALDKGHKTYLSKALWNQIVEILPGFNGTYSPNSSTAEIQRRSATPENTLTIEFLRSVEGWNDALAAVDAANVSHILDATLDDMARVDGADSRAADAARISAADDGAGVRCFDDADADGSDDADTDVDDDTATDADTDDDDVDNGNAGSDKDEETGNGQSDPKPRVSLLNSQWIKFGGPVVILSAAGYAVWQKYTSRNADANVDEEDAE